MNLDSEKESGAAQPPTWLLKGLERLMIEVNGLTVCHIQTQLMIIPVILNCNDSCVIILIVYLATFALRRHIR